GPSVREAAYYREGRGGPPVRLGFAYLGGDDPSGPPAPHRSLETVHASRCPHHAASRPVDAPGAAADDDVRHGRARTAEGRDRARGGGRRRAAGPCRRVRAAPLRAARGTDPRRDPGRRTPREIGRAAWRARAALA